ncbi:MAG: YybH family protein [Nevskiaceae bacterium]
MRVFFLVALLAALSACTSNVRQRDPAAALNVVRAFQAALVQGDEAAARQLLAPEALIYESGGMETREQYASGHLKGDMAFLKAVQLQTLEQTQTPSGDLAVVSTRSRISGEYKGKPVDLLSTETMVLKRGPEDWKIVHIHWSSRPASKAH